MQDAGVAARTRREARAQFGKQLGHDFCIAQARERQATVRCAVLLAERDERLDETTQFLRLRDRRLDGLVTQQ